MRDLIGKVYGRLTVLKKLTSDNIERQSIFASALAEIKLKLGRDCCRKEGRSLVVAYTRIRGQSRTRACVLEK